MSAGRRRRQAPSSALGSRTPGAIGIEDDQSRGSAVPPGDRRDIPIAPECPHARRSRPHSTNWAAARRHRIVPVPAFRCRLRLSPWPDGRSTRATGRDRPPGPFQKAARARLAQPPPVKRRRHDDGDPKWREAPSRRLRASWAPPRPLAAPRQTSASASGCARGNIPGSGSVIGPAVRHRRCIHSQRSGCRRTYIRARRCNVA